MSLQGFKVTFWVPTGAYIVQLQYKIRVGATTPVSGKLDQTWGVIREN